MADFHTHVITCILLARFVSLIKWVKKCSDENLFDLWLADEV